MADSAVYCGDCGEPLDDLSTESEEREPCSECGSTARKRLYGDGGVLLSDWISPPPIREWVETNWSALLGAVALTVASSILGGPAGFVVGIVASAVGVWAFTRVREPDTEHF